MTTERVEITADLSILDQLEERLRRIGGALGPLGGAGGGCGPCGGGGGGGGGGGRGGNGGNGGNGGGGGGNGGGGGSLGGFVNAGFSGGIVEKLIGSIPYVGPAAGAALAYMKDAVAKAANYQRAAATGVAYGMPYMAGGFGYSPAESAAMGSRFFGASATGRGDHNGGLFSTALGFSRAGIDIAAQGGILRGFSAGGGGSFFGQNPNPASFAAILAMAVATGTQTGLKNAKIGDFLSSLATEGGRLADKGIGYDLGAGMAARFALAGAGMEGMQGSALMGNARAAVSGAGGSVFSQGQLRPMMTAYFAQKGWMPGGTQREFDTAHQHLMGNDLVMQDFMKWASQAAGGDQYAYRYMMDVFGAGMGQADQALGASFDADAFSKMELADPRKFVKGIPYNIAGHDAGMQWKDVRFGSQGKIVSEVMAMQDLDQQAAQSLTGGLVDIMKATGLSIENLKELVTDPKGFLERKASDGFNKAMDTGGDALKEAKDYILGRNPSSPVRQGIDFLKGVMGGPPPGPAEPPPPQPRSTGDQSGLMLQTRSGEIIRIELINNIGRPVGARVIDHGELIPS